MANTPITPEEVEAAARVAWAAALVVGAALTIPVVLVHRRMVKRTGMRVVSFLVAASLLLLVYASSAMTLMSLVNLALADRTQFGSTITLGVVYYHPGLIVKLSLLAGIVITWCVLAWHRASRERARAAVT